MHLEKCNNFTTTKWWLDGVIKEGVTFDVLGQSCYANAPNGVAGFQGTPADWKSTFTQLATAYPNLKFLIAEYSAEQRAAGDVMSGLADKRGRGTFNWDPTRSYETLPNDPLWGMEPLRSDPREDGVLRVNGQGLRHRQPEVTSGSAVATCSR